MSSTDSSCRAENTPFDVRELGTIEYQAAWDLQRELASARADGTATDTLLLLEHPPVYTCGRRTEADERPKGGDTPVIDVDRGGKITWHGPGQLVGYPIVGLAEPLDVVQYVRRVEQALIHVCDQLGVPTGRVEGRSGVWIAADERGPERKVAAIGIRVQRGVTMHGFEINCNASLDAFADIIPCGIRDAGVASLSHELGRDVAVAEVLPLAKAAVIDALNGDLPLTDRTLARPEPSAPGITFAVQGA
ncbi:lipoyl(octanoyl) transferase LipB [Actinosynnema pretiosum subsp. pretiosum]|uniref:Octanoyltransferase n=1 Tax=Actinosynnema pretiosum subsp. pretiosum TaxID=103721 RepID=A0AA45R6S9_9PSEU|nr:Octanoate-[acyl-carrier-protein]-protein-N-octanoyltransferase [Actinosynnema pretiosum subsp. pretiosum]QUF07008.1 lipoyl(octanoyl) transferase LipB [Actinosynnema pretiosum subsp. pretiosum]